MSTQVRRTVTHSRVAALAVLTLLIAGLVYASVTADEETVSVPAGAKAGDLTAPKPCDFATEHGVIAAECATLVVPENRADPDSRLIALPVTRIPARSASSAEPVFYLEGGPGISNMVFPQVRPFAETRDVVLVGYRGVDGSVRLDCPEVSAALARQTAFFSDESYRAYGDAFQACAGRLTDEGVDLAGYGIPQEMEDLEAARVALGYDRIDLLSQSAGTRRALIYAWEHPESVHRSVMVGVNPPGHFLWDPQIADEQISRWASLCAEDAACSQRTDDLAASMERTSADMPDRWGVLPINEGNVRLFTFYGLMESTEEAAPMAATWTLDSWLAAAEGDASGLWLQSFFGELMPVPFVWGQYAAAGSLDTQAAREYFSAENVDRTNLGYVGSAFAWGGGRMADGWPETPDAEAYSEVRRSDVETLVINGELDFSTPPQVATRELMPSLPNGQEVILPGFGHTLTFFSDQQDAGANLVNTFYDSGLVDTSLYGPQEIDFTPAGSLPGLAKAVAGIFAGLVVIASILLLWLMSQVRNHGGLSRPASAIVRSLGPVIFGLAGWVLTHTSAYVVMPTLPLGGALFTAVSVGIPVGVGVYLAWVNRACSAATRRIALAAALGGALLGAWLGFLVLAGPLALVTAIIGSGVGVNLSLLTVDIASQRSDRIHTAPPLNPESRPAHRSNTALLGTPSPFGGNRSD